ncbi:MAG: DUF1211 domain-containing protein [Candidatus Eremiobacteraeota bacterium]|nr:DUF1211 domain-containing protein [Candidatus Eremiobacteraeota bacterium]
MNIFSTHTLPEAASTTRIEALSDNIFAVAMTLLVLDLRIPAHAEGSSVWPYVALLWHHMRTFAVSFFIVGLYWVLHHHVFIFVKRSDRTLLWLNLLFMLFVVVTPFSAGLLGAFDDSRTAIAVYGANISLLGISLLAIWWYATHEHRLIDVKLPRAVIRLEAVRMMILPAICVFAVAVSFANTTASIVIFVLAPFLYLWPAKRTIRAKREL